MASVTSLGLHRPSAVPFLVAEGILPPEPSPRLYRWDIVPGQSITGHDQEEELLTTEHCVVWSRGAVVQRVFRFDIEKEPIKHALFTLFDRRLKAAIGTPHRASKLQPHLELQAFDVLGFEVHDNDQQGLGSKVNAGFSNQDDTSRTYASSSGVDWAEWKSSDRALVVILRSQAYVFFLSGTSHIVHLPFEVHGALSLPNGLLLQRVPSRYAAPSTPSLPSVPQNSFAREALASPVADRSSQARPYLQAQQGASDLGLLISPILEKQSQQANGSSVDAKLPSLYCLLDPLAEIGVVIAQTERQRRSHPSGRHVGGVSIFDEPDSVEKLLYVSQPSDLGFQAANSSNKSELLVAVSQNKESGATTIWSVEYFNHGSYEESHSPWASKAGRRSIRRRSSYGIGTGTGANTPVARGSTAGRESFGIARSRNSAARDLISEDSFHDGEEDLASQLDSALDNPSAPVKSSRRVSSLLARADLSSSMDKTAFSDLAHGYTASTAARRNGPFGAQGARLSSGISLDGSFARIQYNGAGTSVQPIPGIATHTEYKEDVANEGTAIGKAPDSPLIREFVGLRKEMKFTKIHSIASENAIRPQQSDAAFRCANSTIFIVKTPAHVLWAGTEHADAFLCIVDRSATSLLVVSLRLSGALHDDANNNAKVRNYTSSDLSESCSFETVGIRRCSGVVDACRIRVTGDYRLLTLNRNAGGHHELCLQDPWNPVSEIRLPPKLAVYNPYQILNATFPRQQREGGFKRILSQGPRALVGLRPGGQEETVNVIDADGSEHQISIQLQPRNSLVATLIKLCDALLSSRNLHGEPILSSWFKVMVWLSTKSDIDGDVEWIAFTVVLFSMAARFLEVPHTENTTRQRRRKTGLLRSSSGANTNLESWETMLIEESGCSSSGPAWMHDEAWSWTAKQSKVSTPPRTNVPRKPRSSRPSVTSPLPPPKKLTYLMNSIALASEFNCSSSQTRHGKFDSNRGVEFEDKQSQPVALATLLVGIHLLREEYKLDILASKSVQDLTPILAQLGGWLRWPSWGFGDAAYYMLESADMESWLLDDSTALRSGVQLPAEPFYPPSVMHFIEAATMHRPLTPFYSLINLVDWQAVKVEHQGRHDSWIKHLKILTPRTVAINRLLTTGTGQSVERQVEAMKSCCWDLAVLETLPESVAIPFRAAISYCQAHPLAASDRSLLGLLGREDLKMHTEEVTAIKSPLTPTAMPLGDNIRDVHSVCSSTLEVDTIGAYDGTAEADRHSTTRMIFKDDQRFAEVAKLLHPLHVPMAKCVPEPDWSDTDLLEAQQELANTIAMRTLAVSPGRSCLLYSARLPLLTEKFPIHGFTLSCLMSPSNTTVTADKVAHTEEKVSWAFFHAGVEAGLSISKYAKGLGTSWIIFNKPHEPKNRHAGFLLALGLNGHLKPITKWLAFKYLSSQHTMTSIGLLLGSAASYLGTMDTVITRLLSIHVTRMLPPGAADLNLSPLTQTSGIMGIGLLYCGTQHRRMSEIMLTEMEFADEDDSSSPQDSLRDEGYRLAAGFALGYINLGRGQDLKGLHDMHIVQRLVGLATETKKVTIVHVLDKATAAATVAIALIFMKTHNEVVARKIDVPDTIHQFEYVRPDIFLLRTVARHLIMWNNIRATLGWVKAQLPEVYQHRAKLTMIRSLNSDDMPFFNIVAGLCLAVGLRYAGTGSAEARNLLCHYLDQFMRICRLPVLNYDGKLARITVRNCQDVVALSSACVMAGTGDLPVFRRLRSLHGRVEADVPYGSHLAAHLASGILFLGGGTHSLGTSDIAVASLLCAFYPLFPTTVLDNKSHLQAFRHFWVFAAEPRCLVVYDVDTRRLISMPVAVTLQSGSEIALTAPCLLPELNTITKIQTVDPEYWCITLDLSGDQSAYQVFNQQRGIWVRRRAAYDAQISLFSTTMLALNDVHSAHMLSKHVFEWVYGLGIFANYDQAEQALVLPPDLASNAYQSTRGTAVDDRLVLENACMASGRSEKLWNLRILFAWANSMSRSGGHWGWIGKEVVEKLQARLMTKKVQQV